MTDYKCDPLKPSIKLLCSLGSIIVHLEEGISDSGHNFNLIALRSGLDDPEVRQWVKDMGPLVPRKR